MFYTVGDTVDLYERNYVLLRQLVPQLSALCDGVVLQVGQVRELHIDVTERSTYSSILILRYRYGGDSAWLPDVHLTVRVYHDAQVAEVTGYQQQIYRRPWYEISSPPGYRKSHEKRQINLFLNECLNHCRRDGCCLMPQGNLTSV